MDGAAWHRPHVELAHDPPFERRIRRLALVSAIALGLIWTLVVTTLDTPMAVEFAFAIGWLLMPSLLIASLSHPRLRIGLVVPATFVSVGLVAICVGWLPVDPVVAIGWIVLTIGIAMGGVLGLWFWYRLVPVPPALDHPFSSGRWALVTAHVALVVAGFGLAALALLG